MDFQTTVNINTNIYSIQKLLQIKHGRIRDLKLYKGAIVKEENELCDEYKTLKECGVEGGMIKEDAPKLNICYDFKPVNQTHDPILLSWMG